MKSHRNSEGQKTTDPCVCTAPQKSFSQLKQQEKVRPVFFKFYSIFSDDYI